AGQANRWRDGRQGRVVFRDDCCECGAMPWVFPVLCGTRCEYVPVRSRAASLPHTVPHSTGNTQGSNRRAKRTKKPPESGSGLAACAEALPFRDRPRPWMAEASIQGRNHSVSREGNASAQARTKPATTITPTNAKKLPANP